MESMFKKHKKTCLYSRECLNLVYTYQGYGNNYLVEESCMKHSIFKKRSILSMPLLLSLVIASALLLTALVLTAAPVLADTSSESEHGTALDEVMQKIRQKQNLGPDEAIDPRQVSDKDLEELGDAVMSIMVPDPGQHELMDRMMGGEGSESLRVAHMRMGYNYLASLDGGKYGWYGRRGMMGGGFMGSGMMGRGMMGGYWRGHSMFFPFGGVVMWILVIIVIGVVVYLLVRAQRSVGGSHYDSGRKETPLEIAKKRYARGEISKEEYETIKRNL
jgi:uncharacterized membrane protein